MRLARLNPSHQMSMPEEFPCLPPPCPLNRIDRLARGHRGRLLLGIVIIVSLKGSERKGWICRMLDALGAMSFFQYVILLMLHILRKLLRHRGRQRCRLQVICKDMRIILAPNCYLGKLSGMLVQVSRCMQMAVRMLSMKKIRGRILPLDLHLSLQKMVGRSITHQAGGQLHRMNQIGRILAISRGRYADTMRKQDDVGMVIAANSNMKLQVLCVKRNLEEIMVVGSPENMRAGNRLTAMG
mmetsp:Transcript_87222/g.136530  ORF Transcript_87222/g.136530 Transcript_87222/m.136530 type:complete len:241 (+) Transcript_87222:258-980(+)